MRTFLAAIIGIFVCFSLVFLIEMLGMKLFPVKMKIDASDLEALKKVIDHVPLPALLTVIAGHGLAMFFGAFVSYKIQANSMSAFLVIFIFMLIATISNLAMIPHPLWFMIADIGVVLLAAFIAWRSLNWK